MSKCKSTGDLIAELKAHRGLTSLRKVSLPSSTNTPVKNRDDEEPRNEFKLVTLRHVNAALP